jgi:hypothetical protein
MNTTSKIAIAAVVALAGTSAAQAFTVPNFNGPDPSIGSPGYADFSALNLSASLTANSSGTVYTLTIQGSNPNIGVFNFPNTAYLVGNEAVKLTASFDSTGHLLTGSGYNDSYEIDGSLAASSNPTFGSKLTGFSWAAQPVEKLFSATLTGVTVDSRDEALGFRSTNFGGWANQKQFTGTTGVDTESVWLYSLLSSSFNSSYGSSMASAAHRGVFGGSDWDSFLAEIKNHNHLKTGTFFGIGSIATVPLPAGILLLGSALLGLGGRLRRRHGQPQPA